MTIKKQVRAAIKGDKDALLRLIMEQQNDYYGLAYSFLRNEHDAMDACEEMIIIVYEQIQHLKKIDSFYSWSKTILVNVCKKMLLKRSKETVTLNDNWEEVGDNVTTEQAQAGEHAMSAIELKVDLEEAVKQLPEDTQEIIKLKYWFDLDLQHVAEVMGMPIGTVKSRLHYAKKRLFHMVERGERNE